MNKRLFIRLLVVVIGLLIGAALVNLAIDGASRDPASANSASDTTFKHVPLKRGGGKAI